MCLSQGDITLSIREAIVNAANETLCGCFTPNHTCLDHQIHERAGPELVKECRSIMQGKIASPGDCMFTAAYRLPCKFIVHAYGPNLNLREFHDNKQKARDCLRKTYINCLNLARINQWKSLAFPALSTGLYKFDPHDAARIAIETTLYWLRETGSRLHVEFVLFPENFNIYKKQMSEM